MLLQKLTHFLFSHLICRENISLHTPLVLIHTNNPLIVSRLATKKHCCFGVAGVSADSGIPSLSLWIYEEPPHRSVMCSSFFLIWDWKQLLLQFNPMLFKQFSSNKKRETCATFAVLFYSEDVDWWHFSAFDIKTRSTTDLWNLLPVYELFLPEGQYARWKRWPYTWLELSIYVTSF